MMYVLESDEPTVTGGVECLCVCVCMSSRAALHCGLLTLDSAAVWPEGVLPGERHRVAGLARLPGTQSSTFCLKCNSHSSLLYLSTVWRAEAGVCVCEEGISESCSTEQVSAFTLCECVCVCAHCVHNIYTCPDVFQCTKVVSPFSLLRSCTRCW